MKNIKVNITKELNYLLKTSTQYVHSNVFDNVTSMLMVYCSDSSRVLIWSPIINNILHGEYT